MRIIEPSITLESELTQDQVLKHLEKAGRVCYKSESRISETSAEQFIKNILKSGHESVIEHVSLTVRVVCDRGVSHEIVRHRLASYSQESTRYCNYSSDKFSNELTLIKPCFWAEGSKEYLLWENAMLEIEKTYNALIATGAAPQEARSVLPNSLKTELLMTMNLREWRHFLRLRTSLSAHPQIRQVALMIYQVFLKKYPVIFSDVETALGKQEDRAGK